MLRMVQASDTIESVTGMNLNQKKSYWVQYDQQECGCPGPQSGEKLPFFVGDESCHARKLFGYHDGFGIMMGSTGPRTSGLPRVTKSEALPQVSWTLLKA